MSYMCVYVSKHTARWMVDIKENEWIARLCLCSEVDDFEKNQFNVGVEYTKCYIEIHVFIWLNINSKTILHGCSILWLLLVMMLNIVTISLTCKICINFIITQFRWV